MDEVETVPVVTCFLRNNGEILLLERSDAVGSYHGQWGAVAGHLHPGPDEPNPDRPLEPIDAAWREIVEETGLGDACTLVRSGEPFTVEDRDRGTRWVVHPFLFECDRRDVSLDEEHITAEWVSPPAILERDTVPDLATSYAAVAPTLDTIRTDEMHGSSTIARRALEVLRDRAAGLSGTQPPSYEEVASLGRDLREARPDMAALRTRIDRVMATAVGLDDREIPSGTEPGTPTAVEAAAVAELERAWTAVAEIVSTVGPELRNRTVATLSRSGTVSAVLGGTAPDRVIIAESRPGGEGIEMATELTAAHDVTLTTDSILPGLIADRTPPDQNGTVDVVLLGADAIQVGFDEERPPVRIVNKVGSYAAVAAASETTTTIVVASEAKVTAGLEPPRDTSQRPPDWPEQVATHLPLFEAIPLELVDMVITEIGAIERSKLQQIARDHREAADWMTA